jgi:CheY-like chemotaxis protein
MDLQMPTVDGYEATHFIRDYEKRFGKGRVPIIAVTAHARSEDRIKCLEAGMDDYIAKPFLPNEIIQKIRAALKPK